MAATRNLGLGSKPGATYERVLHEDTRKVMDQLVLIVKTMTGVGTGFTLKGTTAIGPICAYIASERVGNNEFSKESARKAACLNPKTFQETLATIELVLSLNEKTTRDKRGRETVAYESLVGDYDFAFPDFMVSCMRRVEDAVVNSGMLKKRLAPPNAVARISIFMWVCGGLGQSVDELELISEYKLPEKDIEQVDAAIFESCRVLKQTIKQEWQAVRSGKRKASEVTTPSQQAASLSPPKQSTRQTTHKSTATPIRTPTTRAKFTSASRSSRPRDEEPMQVDETPSKKRRTSPSKPPDDVGRNAYTAFQTALATPSQSKQSLKSVLQASSSKLTLDLLVSRADAEHNDEESDRHTQEPIEEIPIAVETEPSDIEMGGEEVLSEPPHLPMTPRRSSRPSRPKFVPQTPNTQPSKKTPVARTGKGTSPRKAAKARDVDEDIFEEELRERRHRPVLLSQTQWFMGDVRVETEWEIREERMKEWMEARGGPIALLAGRA